MSLLNYQEELSAEVRPLTQHLMNTINKPMPTEVRGVATCAECQCGLDCRADVLSSINGLGVSVV